VIVVAVVAVVAVNLLIYALGRACGGAFTYIQTGKATRVDVVAVTVMSAGPLAIGLTLTAWLTRRWQLLMTPAKIVASVLAISTVWAMTVPAGFDSTSTLCLAAMHLVVAAAFVLALDALAPRPVSGDAG